ncbi:LysR family transcriptional regulator [Tropicimonas sp. IMCC6043]|uniref:LysR family transcriptional regulator n=1 Tax=Tropicimonas sp. IMCC6043 TaxID=2510645 RepID=UPI001A92A365|nr:LysR family transcriptional regulator [Tropicimonas sp. IMCC6043]
MIDVRAMEVFEAAMACGSMTAAARQIGIGQPAVTRLVKDLEAEVGFQLFQRNGPRISPTDQGLRFYEEVQRVLSNMRQIRERATAIREDCEPSIDIAATPTMSGGLLSPALARMPVRLPHFVNAQTMDAEHVVRALRNRTADFGMSAFPLEHAGLKAHVICEARVVAVLPADHPLAARDVYSLSEMSGQRLVTVGNAFRLRRSISAALRAEGVEVTSEFSTNSSLNAVMAARSGLGVALVDPVTAFGIPVEGVAVLPIDHPIPFAWGLLSPSDRVLNKTLSSFVESFRDASAAVVPGCTFHDAADDVALRHVNSLAEEI